MKKYHLNYERTLDALIVYAFVFFIAIVIIGCVACSEHKRRKSHEQLVQDLMAEYQMDRPTAERKIRLRESWKP